jgi:hypothetical protein
MTPADLAAIEATKIQRWDLEFVNDCSEARRMDKSDDGDWVDHDDHVAIVATLRAEVRRLQADNERMRRGLAVAVERGKQNTPFGACVIAENLLAGREWNSADGAKGESK